mgnify:CR=1 FL=1
MNAVWIVLPILTLLMFELGLTLEIKDFKLFRQRPYPVFCRIDRTDNPFTNIGFCIGLSVSFGTSVLYRPGTYCLFSGWEFFQYILYDS